MNDRGPSRKEDLPQMGEEPQQIGVTILELRLFSCRYIIRQNDEGDTRFCGTEVHRVSYCKTHYSLCYVKTKPLI